MSDDERPAKTQPEDEAMTSKDVIKLKMIVALIEAIEVEDEDDAKEAIKNIKTLLGVGDAK